TFFRCWCNDRRPKDGEQHDGTEQRQIPLASQHGHYSVAWNDEEIIDNRSTVVKGATNGCQARSRGRVLLWSSSRSASCGTCTRWIVLGVRSGGKFDPCGSATHA